MRQNQVERDLKVRYRACIHLLKFEPFFNQSTTFLPHNLFLLSRHFWRRKGVKQASRRAVAFLECLPSLGRSGDIKSSSLAPSDSLSFCCSFHIHLVLLHASFSVWTSALLRPVCPVLPSFIPNTMADNYWPPSHHMQNALQMNEEGAYSNQPITQTNPPSAVPLEPIWATVALRMPGRFFFFKPSTYPELGEQIMAFTCGSSAFRPEPSRSDA